ncbi:N-acetylmuramoyl-L-alanine amidase [Lacticigenium naphthae]|uniref:N-acetylmuramoyl-L-alanine amidase n=1 Tax=Lacticigenium naphthae TaxID=515351 RepID=UPI00040F17E5|nr:N-acetylmuramoyl-L-alanine amidase [Lacticigenium naphthae]
MKSIMIDPGHGGSDSGATAWGIAEKEWNLKMSLYQFKRLKEMGASVSLTRSQDQTLEPNRRAALIRNRYDYCISNHFNAYNGSVRGIETIHSHYAKPALAQALARGLQEATGLPIRRVFDRKMQSGEDYYFMHRKTGTTQVVIIEYGFLDHSEDVGFYSQEENFYSAAEAVIKVLCLYLGIRYTEKDNTKSYPKKLYRVQVGAYGTKTAALKIAEELKEKGYETVIK